MNLNKFIGKYHILKTTWQILGLKLHRKIERTKSSQQTKKDHQMLKGD